MLNTFCSDLQRSMLRHILLRLIPKMWVQCGYISPLPKRKTHSEVSLSGLMVEIVGVEPTTPCLQSRCSSQLSYTPVLFADANMTLFFELSKKNCTSLRFFRTVYPYQAFLLFSTACYIWQSSRNGSMSLSLSDRNSSLQPDPQ